MASALEIAGQAAQIQASQAMGNGGGGGFLGRAEQDLSAAATGLAADIRNATNSVEHALGIGQTKPATEIGTEVDQLGQSLNSLIAATKSLGVSIDPILAPASTNGQTGDQSAPPSTAHGQALRNLRTMVDQTVATINDLASRVRI